MKTLNRNEFPPGGGWTYRQPQTNWTNPNAMIGFDASVDAIVKHRLQHNAVTLKHRLSTDPRTVALELERYTRVRLGIPEPTPSGGRASPSFFVRSGNRMPDRVAAVAADIKRAAKGTGVILDWLTSGGKPVAKEIAEGRAGICAKCQNNVPGSWYTVAPAQLIRETLEARKDLQLETSHDAALQSCGVCKCLLRLKVWCPILHIKKQTAPEVMAEFPSHCWIKNES